MVSRPRKGRTRELLLPRVVVGKVMEPWAFSQIYQGQAWADGVFGVHLFHGNVTPSRSTWLRIHGDSPKDSL